MTTINSNSSADITKIISNNSDISWNLSPQKLTKITLDLNMGKSDLVSFDYTATVDDKPFKGNEGKNTQLTLGKDLFLKGFDKQLYDVKKDDEKIVESVLPENFPEKELVNKNAKFNCKIQAIKKPEEVKIDDNFAKNLGAKDFLAIKK